MSEETYRIFKVILMFIFAFIAWNYVQTQRYSSVNEYILVDMHGRKIYAGIRFNISRD